MESDYSCEILVAKTTSILVFGPEKTEKHLQNSLVKCHQ